MTPWIAGCQPPWSCTISLSLLKFMSIELVMVSNHFILCCPLLLTSIFHNIRFFSNELFLPGGWSIGASASAPPMNIQGWFPLGLTDLISLLSSSVQFICSVMTNSLRPHEPQHARPPCPSPTARVYPNPCPLSQWCHPTISSSVVPSPPALNLSQHQGLFKWEKF